MMRANEPFRSPIRPDADPAAAGRPRARVIAASAAFHAVVITAMLLIPGAKDADRAARATRVTFYAPKLRETPPPPPPVAAPDPGPQPEPPTPPPRPEPKPRAEPPRPRPAPAPGAARPVPPEPPPAARPPDPVRREVRAVVLDAPPVEPVAPGPRRVARTGSFGTAAETPAQTPQPAATPSVARVGGFATDTDAPVEVARNDAPRVVARGSFGTENGTVSPPPPAAGPESVTVGSSGFGDRSSGPVTEGPSRPAGTVTRGGFGDAEATTPEPRSGTRRARPAESLDTPVEIVSKPKPVYTDDARQRRIEGEVVLQVTFDAAGTVHVLGVLQGLGFGLDEAAVDAASEIEFKPARREGRPVDHTATLRVVFRLA